MPIVALMLATAFLLQEPQPVPAPATGLLEPVALVVTFEDRVTHQPVGPSGATAWTPMFPRVAGWRPAAGQLTAAAVRYRVQRTEDGFRYAVSVLLGPEHQREEQVAAGALRVDEPVTVDGLLAYGVRPIAIALQPLASAPAHQPAVVNRTLGLHVSNVEIVTTPAPRYRVTIENLTDREAVVLGVESRREGRQANSGIQGHDEGEPILTPRGTHSFDWPFATGPQPRGGGDVWAPLPVDEIIVTGVAWADGSSEGDAVLAARQHIVERARRVQLDRLIPLLRDATLGTSSIQDVLPRLAQSIDALPIEADSAVAGAAKATAALLIPADDADRTIRLALQRVKTRASTAVSAVQASYVANGNSDEARRQLIGVLQRFSAWRDRLER